MRLIAGRESIHAAISQVLGGVEKRQTMQVLSNVLLDARAGQLMLVTTDLEIQLSTRIDVQIQEEGKVTVNARKLADIIKSAAADAEISFSIEDQWFVIDIGTGKFRLATIDAQDFPLMTEEAAYRNTLTLGEKELHDLIDKTQFSMAQQDVRYFLNGLLLEVRSDEIVAVATDGHRLAYAQIRQENPVDQDRQAIIPRKMILELLKSLDPARNAPIELALGDSQISLTIGQNRLISKLIDGKYPDYNRVIPKNNSKTLIAAKADLRQVLLRASILSNERFAGAYFHLSQNELVIESNNAEHESSREAMAVQYTADDLKISFNISYMLNIIAVIDSADIAIYLESPDASVLICPTVDGPVVTRYVLMPMKL
ncbi:DNA polymerase III subunit beta [Halothiobacillus diazotrophicus]|uniref:Beta sliding clamp n=1 Tax=Halothiobacillus diazotrophicus TaxID=1860122 RepID=A0A191ZI10_9GAMM|nr:DNA polymerase III subunit beta [Halothiobacillus diazotrophicus]ANJ67514.1 DNA polymerase III subunit beta [Halothiobacillus diazotrophicus]